MARLGLLFFLSGAAVLVIETTWLRWFALLFGATAPAASATLAAFFAGQALGAAWAGSRASGWRRPLRTYGLLELAGAAGALATPLVLVAGEWATAQGYDGLQARPGLLATLRFALAMAATLPAAFAFGATLPAVGAAAMAEAGSLGTRGSALYGWNTAGAALGASLASFALPDWLGVRATYAVGLALGVGVGVTALALARSRETLAGTTAPRRLEGARPRTLPRLGDLMAVAALSGFAALAGQVLLVHAFAQVLNQSVYAFGSVVVVVLAALALGAAIVARLSGSGTATPLRLLSVALVGSALCWLAFPALFAAFSGGMAYVGSERAFPGYLFVALGQVAATAGPPLLFAALLLPATFAAAGRRAPQADPATILGRLAAANTVGAIAGALAAPWLLLPALGLFGSFGGLAALLGLGALGLGDIGSRALRPGFIRGRALRLGFLGAGVAGLLWLASPFEVAPVRLAPGETLVEAASTPAGAVAVVRRSDGLLIRTDNHYALGGSAEKLHEERQGHLPLLLHRAARRVAYVGTATAITAGASTAHPVEAISLVEIVPAVSSAARRHFGPHNRRVHDDPRARVVVDDARNFLRATSERYDVVVADLFVPWRSGTGSLYTLEHYRNVRARLRPGGILCQWLPLYQLDRIEFEIVARTFVEVFPRTALFRADFYGAFPVVALVGFRDDPAPAAAVSAAARRLAARGERDRWVAEPLGPWSLYVGALGPGTFPERPLNRDDRPVIQYRAARSHVGGRTGKRAPFVGEAFARFGEALRRADVQAGHPLYPDLTPEAARASEGGALLQLAGAFYSSGRHGEAGRALAAAARRLPPQLLGEAPADPSAADVWHALD